LRHPKIAGEWMPLPLMQASHTLEVEHLGRLGAAAARRAPSPFAARQSSGDALLVQLPQIRGGDAAQLAQKQIRVLAEQRRTADRDG
jgi:hypothetical protein